jgi:glycosyltransferase involved in cell wall biosynthesis
MQYDVVHVVPTIAASGGGPTEALCGLAIAQHQLGMKVAVVTGFVSKLEGLPLERLNGGGVDVVGIGPTSGMLAGHRDMSQRVNAIIQRSSVAHLHGIWEQILYDAASAAVQHRVPYVWRSCGMLDEWSLAHHRFRKQVILALRVRWALNHAAVMHFTSVEESSARDRLGLVPKGVVEPNGVDLDSLPGQSFHAQAAEELRRRYPALAGRPVVLYLSRLSEKKSPDLLMSAYCDLVAMSPVGPKPALLMVGDGDPSYVEQLRGHARTLGLTVLQSAESCPPDQGVCVMPGILQGPLKTLAFHGCDVFALPSMSENFGIAVAEAMASAKPVVITPQVDLATFVTQHQAGLVVQRERKSWAQAMARLLSDPPLAIRMGQAGSIATRTHFGWPEIAQRWQSHYAGLVGSLERRRVAL